MINHNELATRLNKRLYKDTITNIEEDNLALIEETIPAIQPDNIEKSQSNIISLIVNYIEFAFNVILFGYATQFILNANWPIFGILAVGYTINFIFNKILFLFSL